MNPALLVYFDDICEQYSTKQHPASSPLLNTSGPSAKGNNPTSSSRISPDEFHVKVNGRVVIGKILSELTFTAKGIDFVHPWLSERKLQTKTIVLYSLAFFHFY
jgi:hypothetical protein